ncbi:MAG: hypothetical protein AB7E77_13580 [Desulfobulbus sp.]
MPPWLVVALLLMIFRLPQSMEMLSVEIMELLRIEEAQRLELAVEGIEDGAGLGPDFTADLPDPAKMAPEELMAAFSLGANGPNAAMRDWLNGGACARFRAAAAGAIAGIGRAQWVEGRRKELLRQLIENKKELMAANLASFDDAALREVIRREIGPPPPNLPKNEAIALLLAFDQEKSARLRTRWGISAPDSGEGTGNGASGGDSFARWRLRLELVLTYPFFLIDMGVVFIPIMGLVTVLLPGVRQRWVEKRFGLRPEEGGLAEIEAIKVFAGQCAGTVAVRTNLLRPGIAFVYPGGDMRPRLALLGGMFALWRRSPKQARAVVLHESMHVRRGDYLLVGYGSIFERYLSWLVVGFAGLLVPLLVLNQIFSVGSIGLHPFHHCKAFALQLGRSVCAALSIFCQMLAKIILPLLALWALELNADYGVGREAQYLESIEQGGGRWSWLSRWAGWLTHPPLWIRRWFMRKEDWLRGMLRQLLFPAASVAGLLMLVLAALFAKLATGGIRSEDLAGLLDMGRSFFCEHAWLFAGMAMLILLWPLMANGWERLFCTAGRRYRRWDKGGALASLFLAIAAICAWRLGQGV